ncbi:MAG: class IV adenylate cyclase [Rhodothermales bacterium]|nr:class IV adenylate cyclase [Rhodothermales bacterium]
MDTGRAVIIEFKAACSDLDAARKIVNAHEPRYVGKDQQVDAYYIVPAGRLKLRTGPIENTLIFYNRPDGNAPKQSDVHLYKPAEVGHLKNLLDAALESDVVVRKTREIYFVGNVKIHLDDVEELGTFIEVEAIDEDGSVSVDRLKSQCRHFFDAFGITEDDLIAVSYSDLIRAWHANS